MTRIDFYILDTADEQSRRVTACKLVEKALRQGHRIFIQTASEDETKMLDDLLWTFRQGSFVPHAPAGLEADEDASPVLIGHAVPPSGMDDVLVNLSGEVPEEYQRFGRLAEVVDQNEARRQAGRVRYKAYKDAGYVPETHRLDGSG